MLSALGYDKSGVAGGAAGFVVNASWPGPPDEYDLRRISGVMHFRANEGRLMELKPGATGRVFGLLMLTSLPRRLTLDFSDLFEKGLSYQRMEGSFHLDDGHAFTNNFLLESDTAKIEVAGRTGLVQENYDQVVTVTPKLSSTLPLAAIWLAEKVFDQSVFDKAFSYQYTVEGPWSDPKVERVRRPQADIEIERSNQ